MNIIFAIIERPLLEPNYRHRNILIQLDLFNFFNLVNLKLFNFVHFFDLNCQLIR